MPLAELEQETERSWIELLSVLNSLGKKQLIEIHKGEGYVPYWLPVELDESPQLRGINANVWRFRLTSAGYELLKRETAQKPAETGQKATPAKGWGTSSKKVIGWIIEGIMVLALLFICLYFLGTVTGIFVLAALLTILHYLGWLEPVKALISKILGSK
ncbi:hypothetical protein ES703_83590 [subsurface metagenome]